VGFLDATRIIYPAPPVDIITTRKEKKKKSAAIPMHKNTLSKKQLSACSNEVTPRGISLTD